MLALPRNPSIRSIARRSSLTTTTAALYAPVRSVASTAAHNFPKFHVPTHPPHARLGPPVSPSPFSSANQYLVDVVETVFASPENQDPQEHASRQKTQQQSGPGHTRPHHPSATTSGSLTHPSHAAFPTLMQPPHQRAFPHDHHPARSPHQTTTLAGATHKPPSAGDLSSSSTSSSAVDTVVSVVAAAPEHARAFTLALATAVRACMQRGELVPDELVHAALLARLRNPDCAERGWVLDGYPRTALQAKALVASSDQQPQLIPDVVVELHIDDAVAMRRITGRAASAAGATGRAATPCPNSDTVRYQHEMKTNPGVDMGPFGECFKDGKGGAHHSGHLSATEESGTGSPRTDDMNPMAVLRRLHDYEKNRAGILDVLGQVARVEVIRVDDCLSREDVAEKVLGVVGNAKRVVLMGKAGSGKSVQGKLLMESRQGAGPIHVSTGSLLRKWTAIETGFADVTTLSREDQNEWKGLRHRTQLRPQRKMLL